MSGDIAVFSPEEVWALVRAADGEQDGAIYLTAAFTGLRRGELLALRWRDVDFAGRPVRVRASYAGGALTSPKSGKVRSVPLAPEVAESARAARRPRVVHRRRRPRLPRRDRRLPRRVGPAAALQRGAASRRTAAAALPRPAAHVRHARDRQRSTSAACRSGWATPTCRPTMRYLHFVPRAEDARARGRGVSGGAWR